MKTYVFMIQGYGRQRVNAESAKKAIEIIKRIYGDAHIISAWDQETGIDFI